MAVSDAAGANNESTAPIPHVLHVADAGVFARFGRMFRQLGLALSEEGVRVSLLTDDAEAAAELDGTPVADHLFRPFSGWGVWRLHGYLRRQFDPPPDVVHLWSTTSLGFLSDWTLACNATLVIHVTSLSDVERLKRRGVRGNEQLLAACDEYGELLRERWPTLADSVRVFRPALLPPEKVPELAVRGKTLGLLWSGSLDKQCGLEVLIEAVAQLRARKRDLHLGLIGRGPATRAIWQEIRRKGVLDCCSIIGEPNLWDQVTAGAHMVVVPSCQHELSLAPLLAMSLGRVVVASRDQVADWFIEDETSLQFTPGSAAELADHVTRTARAHPNVLAVARGASEYVRRHHAITILAAELAALYHTLRQARGGATAGEGMMSDRGEGAE
jgi:glycosyltransferase involved in cell wall biosynthesis